MSSAQPTLTQWNHSGIIQMLHKSLTHSKDTKGSLNNIFHICSSTPLNNWKQFDVQKSGDSPLNHLCYHGQEIHACGCLHDIINDIFSVVEKNKRCLFSRFFAAHTGGRAPPRSWLLLSAIILHFCHACQNGHQPCFQATVVHSCSLVRKAWPQIGKPVGAAGLGQRGTVKFKLNIQKSKPSVKVAKEMFALSGSLKCWCLVPAYGSGHFCGHDSVCCICYWCPTITVLHLLSEGKSRNPVTAEEVGPLFQLDIQYVTIHPLYQISPLKQQ